MNVERVTNAMCPQCRGAGVICALMDFGSEAHRMQYHECICVRYRETGDGAALAGVETANRVRVSSTSTPCLKLGEAATGHPRPAAPPDAATDDAALGRALRAAIATVPTEESRELQIFIGGADASVVVGNTDFDTEDDEYNDATRALAALLRSRAPQPETGR